MPLCSGKQPLPISHLDVSSGLEIRALKPMWCLILSDYEVGAGSFDDLKATPNVFSLQEKSDWAGEIFLFKLLDKPSIATSYHQGKIAFTQTSPTRGWKQHCCNVYSAQGKETSPNASMLRKATLAIPPPQEFSYTLWEINQWVTSCSLSTDTIHVVSIQRKALQTWPPLRRNQIWQENSVFYLSGESSTDLLCTTRAKEPLHKHHK